jgi:two-component system cell cycle sensor histidine kinase/response regulator CckA
MRAPLKILLVEDSEDDALLLERKLKKGGYEPDLVRVDEAEAMEEALDRKEWDVVIADYSMPNFSAIEALELVKRKGLDTPFVIVSGAIGEETAVAAMKAGAHDYVMKDNLNRLIPAIARELKDAQVRKERRKAEAALRESQERYRSLVENIDLRVTLLDHSYTIVMSNAAAARTAGLDQDEMVGKKCFELFEGRSTVCSDCPGRRAMETAVTSEAENEVTDRDGRVSYFRFRAFPIFGPQGDTAGFIEVVEDITERKQLEEQLRHSAKMEAIGRMAGGVAHDFNNLLTAIIGFSNMLLRQLPEEHGHREKLIQISRAADRAAGLTRQLLALGRRQLLAVEVLDLNVTINDFSKMVQRLIGEDIFLSLALDPRLWRVKADPGHMEQILLNLAVNARDAMPRGGSLYLETTNTELGADYVRSHASDLTPGEYVMLSVTDTGHGMDARTQSRIFEPFFTTKEAGKGTGLGLSTIYGIVKQHKGHIEVHSDFGQGASFKIYLPREHAPDHAQPEVQRSMAHPTGTETILVVEDEQLVRELACESLEMLGYAVLSACDPEQAIKVSERHRGPIHLLLTDVVMPTMDGASLLKELSRNRPELKVLYMSGYSANTIIQYGVMNASGYFLQKPFTVDGLAGKLRMALDSPLSGRAAHLIHEEN